MTTTLPHIARYDNIWETIEKVCIAFFTFEYICRLYACPLVYGLKQNSPAEKIAKATEQLIDLNPNAVCVCVRMRAHVRVYVHVYVRVRGCVCACKRLCACVCMLRARVRVVCIFSHIDTRIRTQAF